MNILVVDDDAVIRNWIKILVGEIQDMTYTLFFAEDGLEAIEICKNQEIDLVLTDITMPNMDGIKLTQYLSENMPNIYIAALSSYDTFNYVRLMFKNGALDYILKAEMCIEDLTQLFQKVTASRKINQLNNINTPDDSLNLFLNNKICIEDFYNINTFIQDKFCVSIIKIKYQENNPIDIIDVVMNTLNNQNISGNCYYLSNNNYILIYNSKDKSQDNLKQEYLNITTIIDKSLLKSKNVVIENSLSFSISKKMDLKFELLKAISIINSKKTILSSAVSNSIEIIKSNYMNKITLDDIAKQVFLNKSYLCQIFKKEVGLSFNDYLMSIRIQRAKSLLLNTVLPISDVSEYCGFCNQNYFSKVFKQLTGITPLEFRKN